jgi:hypothetical protein
MPALSNPRYERFAQALFAGLAGETRIERAQSTAYLVAYPNCSNGNSAEAAASRLLRRVKPIIERVNELLAQSAKKKKVTIETITDEYNEAREFAKTLQNPATFLAASQAKAKLYKLEVNVNKNINASSEAPQNSNEIAIALLEDVGLHDPDDDAKARALEAYDTMIATLEQIRDDVLGISQH